MTRQQAINFCALNRLPTRYIYCPERKDNFLCIQTILLKILLGLEIPINEDITHYTEMEDVGEKLKELREKK